MFEEHAEVAFNRAVARDTRLMGLKSSAIAASARPGQFVMLRVRGGVDPLLRRPFSICGVQEKLFLILYRVVGKGTGIMAADIREGDRLPVLGPLGRGFQVPAGDGPFLLVAGGIGIAPLLFLASTLDPGTLHFMAGFGSAVEIIPVREILGPAVSPEISTDDGSAGYCGLVTDLLEKRLRQSGVEGASLFTCGPKPMLKRIALMAEARGMSCQASLESAMACGLGACQGCAVKVSAGEERSYHHVCRDGPVFPARAVDWEEL
ncbi:MAG: dihydroorotate dehydrogenase electron transfer subunit [Deltaproteobacteria bacterium]|nr:dihydroorotate dehydrogenase electron transfer subunit [Deltaproteobacteria bacterium]